jgi:TATA-box binding protein (TBP) (component of TFIID and TFIIIB)
MEESLLESLFLQNRLPSTLSVSTMSVTFRLGIIMDLQHISEHITLSTNRICTVDYQGVKNTIIDKQRKKNRKKKSPNFYNSMTLDVSVGHDDRTMHFKVFKNGSIQGAGCQNTQDGNYAIRVLVSDISRIVGERLTVQDLKINLINVNFKIGFSINRDTLYRLLLSIGESASYEKCKHAGVSVKFLPKGKDRPISIFVFESGSIVITGSKNEEHILEGYEFITSLINSHRSTIFKLPTQFMVERAMMLVG